MINYIDVIMSAFDKEDTRGFGINNRASPEDLYKVDYDCEKLSPDKSKMFHNLLAKNLYTTKLARPDTCTAL